MPGLLPDSHKIVVKDAFHILSSGSKRSSFFQELSCCKHNCRQNLRARTLINPSFNILQLSCSLTMRRCKSPLVSLCFLVLSGQVDPFPLHLLPCCWSPDGFDTCAAKSSIFFHGRPLLSCYSILDFPGFDDCALLSLTTVHYYSALLYGSFVCGCVFFHA